MSATKQILNTEKPQMMVGKQCMRVKRYTVQINEQIMHLCERSDNQRLQSMYLVN